MDAHGARTIARPRAPRKGGRLGWRNPARAAVFALALLTGHCGGEGPPGASWVASRSVVDLGRVTVGVTARSPFTLKNLGRAPLRITDARVSESLRGEVRLFGVPAALAVGGAVEIEVRLTAVDRGPRDGVVTLVSESSALEIRVVAVAVDPRLVAEPAIVDFGRVVVGQTATATVALKNAGDIVLTIPVVSGDLGTSAEFEPRLGGIRQLGPGESFELLFAYSPFDVGVDEGAAIVADDGGSPRQLRIGLRGEGTASELEVEPRELSFLGLVVGERRARAIALRNTGSSTHSIDRLEMVSLDGAFVLEPGSAAPFWVPAGAERRIDVAYVPIAEGRSQATLRITSSAFETPLTVVLEGSAEASPRPTLEVRTASVAFGAVQVGHRTTRRFTLASTGAAPVRLTAPLSVEPLGAPIAVEDAPTVARPLEPRELHTLSISLTPEALGPVAAEVVIEIDDPARPTLRIPVTGEGVAHPVGELELDPERIDFGRIPRGVEAALPLAVTNLGSASVTVSALELLDDAGGRFGLDSVAVPFVLAPGARVRTSVRYTDPAGLVAEHIGAVRVTSTDPDRPRIEVPLTARTTSPEPRRLQVELTWDGPADLDLHLVRGGRAPFDAPWDACFCNPNPDWGVRGVPEDDPLFERDAFDGSAPERITIEAPVDDALQVWVHVWDAAGEPSVVARVLVRTADDVLDRSARALLGGQAWRVGVVSQLGGAYGFVPDPGPPAENARNRCW